MTFAAISSSQHPTTSHSPSKRLQLLLSLCFSIWQSNYSNFIYTPTTLLATQLPTLTMAQPRSKAPLYITLAAAGGVGYYLYSAGGNPKLAEKKFESTPFPRLIPSNVDCWLSNRGYLCCLRKGQVRDPWPNTRSQEGDWEMGSRSWSKAWYCCTYIPSYISIWDRAWTVLSVRGRAWIVALSIFYVMNLL